VHENKEERKEGRKSKPGTSYEQIISSHAIKIKSNHLGLKINW
jgi:hypothetical protein